MALVQFCFVVTFSFINGFHSYLDITTLRNNQHVRWYWFDLYINLNNKWIPLHKQTEKVEGCPHYMVALVLTVLYLPINFPILWKVNKNMICKNIFFCIILSHYWQVSNIGPSWPVSVWYIYILGLTISGRNMSHS